MLFKVLSQPKPFYDSMILLYFQLLSATFLATKLSKDAQLGVVSNIHMLDQNKWEFSYSYLLRLEMGNCSGFSILSV